MLTLLHISSKKRPKVDNRKNKTMALICFFCERKLRNGDEYYCKYYHVSVPVKVKDRSGKTIKKNKETRYSCPLHVTNCGGNIFTRQIVLAYDPKFDSKYTK